MTEIAFDQAAAVQALKSGQSLASHMKLSPDLLRAMYAVAVGHYEGGRYGDAVLALMPLVLLDARNQDHWALLGNCHLREGRFEEALQAWQMAMTLKPAYATAAQVARTALALKDKASAAEAIVTMFTHRTPGSQAQDQEILELGRSLEALGA